MKSRNSNCLFFENCEPRVCLSASVAFGSEQMIVSGAKGIDNFFLADMDADDDIDILVSLGREGIRWYENADGHGRFQADRFVASDEAGNVAADDLDSDGDNDVIAIVQNRLTWLENLDRFITFGSPRRVSDIAASNFFLGDFDSDGDTDIATIPTRGHRIDLIFNHEDGFQPESELTTQDRVEWVRAADLNGDGAQDLLVTTDDGLSWFENADGRGDFGDEKTILDDASIDETLAYDVDGDGQLDIVYSGWRFSAWHRNLGNGVFGPAQMIAGQAQNLTIADLDGDNTPEVVYSSWTNDMFIWTEFERDGRFIRNLIDEGLERPGGVAAIDIDRDGDSDLIANTGKKSLVVYKNDGAGVFSQARRIAGQGYGNQSMLTGDIDQDGDLDLLSTANSRWLPHASGISWYENIDGRGTFEQHDIDYHDNDSQVNARLVDLDGDQDLDVVAGYGLTERNLNLDEFIWFENLDGKGQFSDPIAIAATVRRTHREVAFGDVDGDGDHDLMLSTVFPPVIEWFENDGHAQFGEGKLISHDLAWILETVDMDADGDLDLIYGVSGTTNEIGWYENQDGFGNFSDAKLIITGFNGLSAIVTADVSGDGVFDLIVSHSDNNDLLAWYEHIDGKGDFSRRRSIASFDAASSVVASDFDQDGDIDLVASSGGFSEGKLLWFENTNGLGDFKQTIVSRIDDAIMSAVAGDFDGDGRIDIASASHRQGRIAWHSNLGVPGDANGDGLFDSKDLVRIFQGGAYESDNPVGKEDGDFNGDGRFNSRDLVYAFEFGCFHSEAAASMDLDRDLSSLDLVFATGSAGNSEGPSWARSP